MRFTESNNLPLMSKGDFGQFWGVRGVNRITSLVDESLDSTIPLLFSVDPVTGDPVVQQLTPANGASDTARGRVLYYGPNETVKKTGVITIPNRPKVYMVRMPSTFSIKIILDDGSDSIILHGDDTVNAHSTFLFFTDGDEIHLWNRKIIPGIIYFNNVPGGDNNYEVSAADNGKTIMPINGGDAPTMSLPSMSTLPEGFKITIVRGASFSCGISAFADPSELYFGGINVGVEFFAGFITLIVSKKYNRWMILRNNA